VLLTLSLSFFGLTASASVMVPGTKRPSAEDRPTPSIPPPPAPLGEILTTAEPVDELAVRRAKRAA
jgi:hypothetical protein